MVTTEGKTMRAISTEVTNEERVQPRAARSTWGVAWRSGLAGLILQLSIVAALLLQGLIQAGLPGHMARRLEEFGVYIGPGGAAALLHAGRRAVGAAAGAQRRGGRAAAHGLGQRRDLRCGYSRRHRPAQRL
jgi:hypothetical protein